MARNDGMVGSFSKVWPALERGHGAESRSLASSTSGLQERLLEGSFPILLQAVTLTKSLILN